MTNTVAYYDKEWITAVKSFIELAPDSCIVRIKIY